MPNNALTVHNHTIDPESGMLESKAYAYAFDVKRKEQFLGRFYDNGLSIYDTCEELSISHHTINHHYKIDPVFRQRLDEIRERYTDKLEGVSRRNALLDKNYVERFFQLKALLPTKYADLKPTGEQQITININGDLLVDMKRRSELIDTKIIQEAELLRGESAKINHCDNAATNNNS